MAVRLLKGTIHPVGSFAVNDFEAMAAGDTNVLYGEEESGGCTFGTAIFHVRTTA